MDTATIVHLYGSAGSGKTSLALALHERLDGYFLRISPDTIWAGLPRSIIERTVEGEDLSDMGCPSVGHSYVECLHTLASLGFNPIIGGNMPDVIVRDQVLTRLEEVRVLLVEDDCPLEELLTRESGRVDREPGTVERDSRRLHRSLEFDLVVDSAMMSPEEERPQR